MKKRLVFAIALTLGLLLVASLVGRIGWAQGPDGDDLLALSLSSAPVPEGVQIQSPPDRAFVVDAADLEVAQSYNAYLRIAGSALRPRESTVEWAAGGGGAGYLYATSGNANVVFNTPIYLPQGATVKYVRLYYADFNASFNSCAWFTVYDLYGGIVSEWEACSSGNSGEGYSTTEEFTHTVDYASYSYVVNWRPHDLGTDTRACGLRIYYHTPPGAVYLPVVTKTTE